MNCTEEQLRLYGVTDRSWLHGKTLYEQVEAALKGGVTCLQLREKQLDHDAFLQEAVELKELCLKAKELRKKIEEKQKNELFSVLIVSEKCCYR